MLLLSADTSGKNGSIALAQYRPGEAARVLEVVNLDGGTFSAQMVPQIAALLQRLGFHKKDIDGFAVVAGPGSFTGLRVGLAAVKGLAEALGKPIAAVSLLEAVVAAGQAKGRVLAMLEAGRGDVFVGEFEVNGSGARLVGERLVTVEELLAAAGDATIVTPEKVVAEAARTRGVRVQEIARPRSDAVALLGMKKIRAGETVSAETLEANYLRRSDAEIFGKSGA